MAKLHSNRGDHELCLRFLDAVDFERGKAMETTLTLSGSHYDGDHDHDVGVQAEAIYLDARPLRALAHGLLAWCGRDLHDLRVSDLDATHRLCLLDYQTFNLRFGPRDDTVHQSLLAVVSIELTVGVLTAEFHFTADQSCLRLFSTELLRELDEHAA